MKKLITILALAIAIPSMVQAQGTVLFNSTAAAHVIQVNGVSVAPGFANVALYAGAVGSSSNQLQLVGAVILNGAGGGINGGIRTNSFVTPAGGDGAFQVRAWTGAFLTYEAALAGGSAANLAGASALFTNDTGDPTSAPAGTPVNLVGWTSAVQLVPVPEPSTIALGILGAGSLLFLRRKK